MNTITKYILTGLISALVVGGGTYYVVNHQATNDKNDLQAQIDTLNSKVATLSQDAVSSSTAGSPSTTSSATTATPSTTASTTTSISACQSSNLAATLANGSGAAGTYYYNLTVKNNGTTSCTYSGTTTVSLLNSSGTALGSATAAINTAHTTIASSASITAQVSFPNSGNYSTGTCKSGVTTLAVYPPNQTTAVTVTGMDTKNAGFTNFYCPGFAVASF